MVSLESFNENGKQLSKKLYNKSINKSNNSKHNKGKKAFPFFFSASMIAKMIILASRVIYFAKYCVGRGGGRMTDMYNIPLKQH